MTTSLMDHPYYDALRYFDIVLGVVLALGLLGYGYLLYRDKPVRHSLMAALSSWWLVNLSAVMTSLARLGEQADARLPIRLIGHMIGVVFVFTAYSMVREGRRPYESRMSDG